MNKFGNINTIKFLDQNGYYNVKFPRSKEFKRFKYDIKQENISIIDKKLNEHIKTLEKELNKDIQMLQNIFVSMLDMNKKSPKYKTLKQQKDACIERIQKHINDRFSIELVQHNMGIIEPHDIRYASRTIKF